MKCQCRRKGFQKYLYKTKHFCCKNNKKVDDSQLDIYQNNSNKNNQVAQIYNPPVKRIGRISNKQSKVDPLKLPKKLDIEGESKPLIIKSTKHGIEEKAPSLLPLLPNIKKEPLKLEEEQLKRIKQTEELIQQLKERQQKQRRKQKLRNLDN